MPDHSERSMQDFSRNARDGVVPPSFDALVNAQQRRRRTTVLAATGATLLVVALVATTVQATYDDQTAPTPPATSTRSPGPTPTSATKRNAEPLTAEEIVDGRFSQIRDVAATDPGHRAVVWEYCPEPTSCDNAYAVAVTADAFEQRTLHRLDRRSAPSGEAVGDRFLVGAVPAAFLLSSDGTRTDVDVTGRAGPIQDGEILVSSLERGHFALDPNTATAHPIAGSAGLATLQQAPDGRLVGAGFSGQLGRSVARWSTDGGRSWDSQPLPPDFRNLLVDAIPSEAPGVMAFVAGGDGATVLPFSKVYGSFDGGATWATFEEPPSDMAYEAWPLVQPDGSLLVLLNNWSDDRRGNPGSHPHGFYQSDGSNWSDLRFVQDLPGQPDPNYSASGYNDGDYAVEGSGNIRLWIYDYRGNIYESGPGIDTWEEIPAR